MLRRARLVLAKSAHFSMLSARSTAKQIRFINAMRMKLFIMMVIELFIWGAWLPLVWSYIGPQGLNFTGTQQAWIGSAFAISSVVGIFFSNQFADRNFAAEKFLSFSHLIGGLAMLGLFFVR